VVVPASAVKGQISLFMYFYFSRDIKIHYTLIDKLFMVTFLKGLYIHVIYLFHIYELHVVV
jgi:hypothetical protein